MPITPAQLRAEGILEIGYAGAFPFIRTKKRLVLIPGEVHLTKLRNWRSMIPRMAELRQLGYTVKEIGGMYGISDATVNQETNKLGIEWTNKKSPRTQNWASGVYV